jgi:segregation and condensation protein B
MTEQTQPGGRTATATVSPGLVEAILFAAGEPIRVTDVAAAFGVDVQDVLDAIDELQRTYRERDGGLEIRQAGGGYRVYTRAEHAAAVGHFATRTRVGRLSRAALETLAIVAYRQPVTRGEIARIRGVNVDSVLNTLQARGLVDEVGRDDGPGRAPLFATTALFLEKIGLSSVADLPPLGSFAPDEGVAAEIERALAPQQFAGEEPATPEGE